MKIQKRCVCCNGSGKVMGGGMIFKDCSECDGLGKIYEAEEDIEYLNLKMTESYKKAIEEIKVLDPNLSDEKAREIFEKELDNIKQEKKDRKSKRS